MTSTKDFADHPAYGIPAAHSPVFELRKAEAADMADAYLGSFERTWVLARTWRLRTTGS